MKSPKNVPVVFKTSMQQRSVNRRLLNENATPAFRYQSILITVRYRYVILLHTDGRTDTGRHWCLS